MFAAEQENCSPRGHQQPDSKLKPFPIHLIEAGSLTPWQYSQLRFSFPSSRQRLPSRPAVESICGDQRHFANRLMTKPTRSSCVVNAFLKVLCTHSRVTVSDFMYCPERPRLFSKVGICVEALSRCCRRKGRFTSDQTSLLVQQSSVFSISHCETWLEYSLHSLRLILK